MIKASAQKIMQGGFLFIIKDSPSRDSNPGPDSSLRSRSIQLSYMADTKIYE